VLALGSISMLAGLVLLVVSVRLPAPSLGLFLAGGALIGAGAGAVFKGSRASPAPHPTVPRQARSDQLQERLPGA
jgi:hypothetical protein